MIASRENEIKNFVPKPYYGLKVLAGGVSFTWTDSKSGSSRTFDREKIEKLSQNISGKLHVTEVKKKVKKTFSPASMI